MKIHPDTRGPDASSWEDAVRAIISNPLAAARVTETWIRGMILGAGIARVDRLGTSWGSRAAAIQDCYRSTLKMDAVKFMSDGEVRRMDPEGATQINDVLRAEILEEARRK